MSDSKPWKDNPCPLHPAWGLQDVSDLDHKKLKKSIDTDDNKEMVIEKLIYRAYLACLKKKGSLFNQKPDRPSEALKYLQKAEESTIEPTRSENEKIGYGIVINTFRLHITDEDPLQSEEYERKLSELESKKADYPEYEVFVNVVHAYILSRLGPRWRKQALSLYRDAVKKFPKNHEWLLGLALMIGRDARQQKSLTRGKNESSVQQLFEEEREALQKILKLKPDFHHTRALYGQVCFNLNANDPTADMEISKAFEGDPQNQQIAIIAGRYYRRKRSYTKAVNILQDLIKRVDTAEVHCQLAYAYFYKSKQRYEDNRELLQENALRHFTKAKQLDSCHYPAIHGMAKVLVYLGRKEKARRLYIDLFEGFFNGKPHLMLEEFSSRTQALELHMFLSPRELFFSPRQLIKISHKIIELCVALEESNIFDNIITGFQPSYVQGDLDRCLRILADNLESQDDTVRLEASINLASAKLLMKKDIDQTIQHHQNLVKELKASPKEKDILFGLGKCFIIKGNQKYGCGQTDEANLQWDDAIKTAEELSKLEAAESLNKQLCADIYLSKAKAFLNNIEEGQDFDSNHAAAEQLKLAILMGSLEACYIYVCKMQDVKEKFLLEDNVPKTLAGVQLVCENDSPLHSGFTIKDPYGSEIVYSVEAKKGFLQNRVQDVIDHKIKFARDPGNEKLSSLYRQMTTMRKRRLQYEKEFMKKRGLWDIALTEELVSLLEIMREMLDNCISICQKLLLKEQPKFSLFEIPFDWKKGGTNQEKCQREVQKWAEKKTFPEKPLPLPDGFLQKIVQVQPMYDEKNNWLLVLSNLVNVKKHSLSDLRAGGSLSIRLNDNSKYCTIDAQEIVKRGCKEVLYLVKQLIEFSLPSPDNPE